MGLVQHDLFGEPEADLPPGISLMRGRIAAAESRTVLDAMLAVFAVVPPYRLRVKSGAYVINRMTNCGSLGWHSDKKGYRYVDRHPELDVPWPEIPRDVKALAMAVADEAGVPFEPDACLVNFYDAAGKMNLHQDHDEKDFAWPIVSFSFGCDAVFALGGAKRRDPVQNVRLRHGDVLVMHGESRMRFHGVKKIVPETAPFAHEAIPAGGRLNLTFRRAA